MRALVSVRNLLGLLSVSTITYGTSGVLDAPPDPILNGVCLDRSSVDFGFARSGGQETVTLTNNTDTAVRI